MTVTVLPIPQGYQLVGYAEPQVFQDKDGAVWYSANLRIPDGNIRICAVKVQNGQGVLKRVCNGFRGNATINQAGQLLVAVNNFEASRIELEIVEEFQGVGTSGNTTPAQPFPSVDLAPLNDRIDQLSLAVGTVNTQLQQKIDANQAYKMMVDVAYQEVRKVWNSWIDYRMPQLYNVIWNRFLKHYKMAEEKGVDTLRENAKDTLYLP